MRIRREPRPAARFIPHFIRSRSSEQQNGQDRGGWETKVRKGRASNPGFPVSLGGSSLANRLVSETSSPRKRMAGSQRLVSKNRTMTTDAEKQNGRRRLSNASRRATYSLDLKRNISFYNLLKNDIVALPGTGSGIVCVSV